MTNPPAPGLPRQSDHFNGLSLHYYRLFSRLAPEDGELIWISGALAVQSVLDGHSCLSLSHHAGRPLLATAGEDQDESSGYRLPKADDWQTALRASHLVGPPEGETALVLGQGRLYLRRYFGYETRLAREIQRRAALAGHPPERVAGPLAGLFPVPGDETDWQMVAAAIAAMKRLCLISGGPGTGKTHTVLRIIQLLRRLAGDKRPRIALAAPTGKAASRLQEAMRLADEEEGLTANTIHRLLGTIRHSPYFRHHREHRLPLDVLIVDEVSMVDLALMTKLVEAMPDEGRLILLGDQDQLSSVEAGRVLADLCGEDQGYSPEFAAQLEIATGIRIQDSGFSMQESKDKPQKRNPLGDCRAHLRKSYRFKAGGGIGRLAAAVLAGNAELAMNCLAAGEETRVCPPAAVGWGRRTDEKRLATRLLEAYSPLLAAQKPETALRALGTFQVLCSHRQGPYGTLTVNRWFTETLARQGRIRLTGESEWHPGRPVIVTGNHYDLRLFNGDLGVALADDAGELKVYFPSPGGGLRAISPGRMPAHETAFALTVHKSQGSEFDEVLLLLPEQPSPLVSRELIYTAITRARRRFELWGGAETIASGVRARIERHTGLSEQLMTEKRCGASWG